MKNIVAVAMVKNESDIIESFCRHTLSFADRLIICDDESQDNTREIIEKLMGEGLNIVPLANEGTFGYFQSAITTNLANLAVDKFDADLVVPLDADEFLYSIPETTPRDILEQCEGADIYSVQQRHALPEKESLDNGFLPSQFKHFLATDKKESKCFISKEVIKDSRATIVTGNHDIVLPDRRAREMLIDDVLVLGHYPIRSVGQAMTKIIIGWANTLCTYKISQSILERMLNNNERFVSFHWYKMYDFIKKRGTLDLGQLQELVLYSSSDESLDKANIPLMELSGFQIPSDIELRYTDQSAAQNNFLNIILSHYEHIISMYIQKLEDAERM